jgi:hypothetical protein
LSTGADLKVVQTQLGHSSIVLTADNYISLLPDLDREATEAVAELILAHSRLIPGSTSIRKSSPARGVLQLPDPSPGADSI